MLLKSNSFSANLLGVGGGDLKSSGPWLGHPMAGHAGGGGGEGGIVREAPTAAGWRLGGLNSFTALGWLTEWALGPSLAVAGIDDIFIAN